MDRTAYIFLTPLIALFLFLSWRFVQSRRRFNKNDASETKELPKDPYQDIEPLHNFDWTSTPPIKIRPFKSKYHLTMALENCPLSELVAIDNTYLERIRIRKSILDEHPDEVHLCDPSCEPAVMELYEWMFQTYLPRRFPAMFKLVNSNQLPADQKINGPCLHNLPANEFIPLTAPSAREALYTLGIHVDDDILFLLPSSSAADGSPIYHLQAFVCCFPSGFSLPEKYRLPLASIHKPVPGYAAKLEKSMDRFFAKMECGRAVRRANWTVTTHTNLYTQSGNHLYSNDPTNHPEASDEDKNAKTLDVNATDLNEKIEKQKKEVEIENCRLRCERQTLHRLPKTKALVFAFKTYQYKLEDVKAEGSGEALAEAIGGFAVGSVPEMAFYKRGVVWGDIVAEYLRR